MDVLEKHREWLKDYEGLMYSIALNEKHQISWQNDKHKYKDSNWSPEINCIARHPKRLIIEFDGEEKQAKGYLIKTKLKLIENKWWFIHSTHKGKSDYLWIEFTKEISDKEAERFLKWIAPEGSEIDLNFASSKKVFPVLYAVHWKHSYQRELPIEFYEGEKINYDSLFKDKKNEQGFEYKTYRKGNQIIVMERFSPVPYAKELMENYKFMYDKYKRFWRYDFKDNLWKEDAEDFIRNLCRVSLLGEQQQKNNYTNEIVSYIRDLSYNPNFNGELDKNLIPFKNVLYNIDDDSFIDYSPEYFTTNKLPIEMDSLYTQCDIIDSFFEDIATKEYKEILYDLTAYCLYRSQPYQKLFFLFGGGANGKSTYLEMLRLFLGNNNVSSISPHDICGGNRFALGGIWNRYANISSDISYEILKEVNKIKEITGGDTISIERKYMESFPTKLYAKQIFSTNQLPIVNDKTNAWFRRIYLIEFPMRFNKPDREILDKLTTKTQLNGLAWQCIKRLKRMKENGWIFNFDINIDKVEEMYENLSNPLSKFIKENCEVDDGNENAFIWKFELRERFEQWLKDNKMRVWSDTEIGLEMKKKFEDGRRWYKSFGQIDKLYRVWQGLRWLKVRTINTNDRVDIHSIPLQTKGIYIESSLSTPVNPVNPVICKNANFYGDQNG